MNEELIQPNSRRQFLTTAINTIIGITVVGFVSPVVLESCSNPASADLSSGADAGKTIRVDVSSLTSDNMAVHSTAPTSGRGLLIIRRSATVYETLLLVCSHAGCGYPDVDMSGTRIVCRCHNSTFDLNGNVTGGPAPTGLTKFTTTYDATAKAVTITF
ncbi:MAG: Rieske 2Fe-2S domain-containing protein [Bacteroidetes bacterium]|nr:Rieske 2Fe-2S domain-containing protein [Bacteroidota bacterium]